MNSQTNSTEEELIFVIKLKEESRDLYHRYREHMPWRHAAYLTKHTSTINKIKGTYRFTNELVEEPSNHARLVISWYNKIGDHFKDTWTITS